MASDLEIIANMRDAFRAKPDAVGTVTTVTGTATSDSVGGYVMVDLGGASFNASGEQSTELPTQVDVRSGDTVMVTLVGGSPVVTGVVGGGDRTRESIAPAVTSSQTWYKLATDETPAQPTEESHDGWTDSEPIWDEDSDQQLWASVRTETVGDSVTWSAPSKVSAWANVTIARNAIVSTVEESYETKADASATYATKSEVEQTSTALDVRITSAEGAASDALAKADATQTLVRAYEGGVLVAKKGQTYGALVNADGSFDVCELAWSGDEPSVNEVASTFSADAASLLGGTAKLAAKQSEYGSFVRLSGDGLHGLQIASKDYETEMPDPRETTYVGVAGSGLTLGGMGLAFDVIDKYGNNKVSYGTYLYSLYELVAIHDQLKKPLQTWTAFPVTVQQGWKKFYVQDGMATLACDFQLKSSCAAWGANFLTAAQQTMLQKYAPAIKDMKIASLGSTGIIWTLSFDPANNRVLLWPTGGTAPASSYLTTAFMWQVNY